MQAITSYANSQVVSVAAQRAIMAMGQRVQDQILVVEQGQIVERGTHAQLMALGGRYKQLHDRQHGVEQDQFINPGEDFTVPGVPE